jgi:hypothetical protein
LRIKYDENSNYLTAEQGHSLPNLFIAKRRRKQKVEVSDLPRPQDLFTRHFLTHDRDIPDQCKQKVKEKPGARLVFI